MKLKSANRISLTILSLFAVLSLAADELLFAFEIVNNGLPDSTLSNNTSFFNINSKGDLSNNGRR